MWARSVFANGNIRKGELLSRTLSAQLITTQHAIKHLSKKIYAETEVKLDCFSTLGLYLGIRSETTGSFKKYFSESHLSFYLKNFVFSPEEIFFRICRNWLSDPILLFLYILNSLSPWNAQEKLFWIRSLSQYLTK